MKRIINRVLKVSLLMIAWLALFLFTGWLLTNVKLYMIMIAVLSVLFVAVLIGVRLKKQSESETKGGN